MMRTPLPCNVSMNRRPASVVSWKSSTISMSGTVPPNRESALSPDARSNAAAPSTSSLEASKRYSSGYLFASACAYSSRSAKARRHCTVMRSASRQSSCGRWRGASSSSLSRSAVTPSSSIRASMSLSWPTNEGEMPFSSIAAVVEDSVPSTCRPGATAPAQLSWAK